MKRPLVVNTDRQTITITKEIDVPEGTFEEVIDQLKNLWEEFEYSDNATLSYDVETLLYGDEVYKYTINYTRLETDKEMNKRITTEKRLVKYDTKQKLLTRKAELEHELAELDSILKELK